MANKIASKGEVPQFDKVRFELGLVSEEPGLVDRFGHEFIENSLKRHCRGDWGVADELTRRRNERALQSRELWVESVHRDSERRTLVVVTILNGCETYAVALGGD